MNEAFYVECYLIYNRLLSNHVTATFTPNGYINDTSVSVVKVI